VAILGIFKVFWWGSVTMIGKNMYVAGFYGVLGLFIIISAIANRDYFVFVGLATMFLSVFIIGAIYFCLYILPDIRLAEFFAGVFKDIKLKTENHIPEYLYKEEVNEFMRAYTFKCYCPVKLWLAKKDYVEMHMNAKIIDIVQNHEDKAKIHLLTEKKPLSGNIPWSNDFIMPNNALCIGASHFGKIYMDLDQYPHAFIAGETGSGKSNILKCMIHQALVKGYDVILIDFKRGVSFAEFSKYVSIHYEYKDVVNVLKNMVLETITRLDKFRVYGVDNLFDYNLVASTDKQRKKIVFIDELAELLKTKDKETSNVLYDCIETLTRLSRAVGIHLIMAIQRPDANIVGGQIKNNVSYRICGRFVDGEPSRIMLSNESAKNLPNIKGRFIVKGDDIREVQGFYYSSKMVRPLPRIQPTENRPPLGLPQFEPYPDIAVKSPEPYTGQTHRPRPRRPVPKVEQPTLPRVVTPATEKEPSSKPKNEYNFEFDPSLFKK